MSTNHPRDAVGAATGSVAAASGLALRRRLLAIRFAELSPAQRAAYDRDLARIMSASIDGAPKAPGKTA